MLLSFRRLAIGYAFLMCSHYQAVRDRDLVERRFRVKLPEDTVKTDVWPLYSGLMIRRPREADTRDEAVPDREAVTGFFWADTALGQGHQNRTPDLQRAL